MKKLTDQSRGLSTIGIIAIIIAVLAIAGGIYWLQKTEAPVAPSTTDETANWQTYRNETYSYEFKYPLGGSVTGAFTYAPLTSEELVRTGDIEIAINAAKDPETILLQAYPIDTTLEKHISDSIQNKDIIGQGTAPIGDLLAKSLTINGFITRTSNGVINESIKMTKRNKIIFFEKNGVVFRLILGSTGPESPIKESDIKTINQILSTFKFTK